MRAQLFHRAGEPKEVLRLEEIEDLSPAEDEIRVRMLLSLVNPSDLLMIADVTAISLNFPVGPKYSCRSEAPVKAAQICKVIYRVFYNDWTDRLAFVAGIVKPKLFTEQ